MENRMQTEKLLEVAISLGYHLQMSHLLDPKQRLAVVRNAESLRFREANEVKLLLHTRPP